MNNKDYYNILGIENQLRQTKLKSLSQAGYEVSPDKNADDKQAEEKFKEVSEALFFLIQKKRMFDQFGSSGFDPSQVGGFHGHPFEGFEGFGPGGFSLVDLAPTRLEIFFFGSFGDLGRSFRWGPRRKGLTKGADLKYQLDITFEQAALGAEN